MKIWPPTPVALTVCLAGGLEAQDWVQLRQRMVEQQIVRRGISSPAVLQALKQTPRHLFVPEGERDHAYEDRPLAIGHRQTISQPYIVASMSELLEVKPGDRVLEIGTGSGYHAAVLAQLAAWVYSIEIVEPLARQAAERLKTLGYLNVSVRCGDGYRGWLEQAPFDRIILTAAPPEVPPALLAQLKNGGRLVAPVGREWQELVVYEKDAAGKLSERVQYAVMFVPMVPGP